MHSAAWDPKTDCKGKTVAVLGCGSSGVQIVPTLQPRKSYFEPPFLHHAFSDTFFTYSVTFHSQMSSSW